MHQEYGTICAQLIEHHQLIFVPTSATISTMSRFNYMNRQDLVIHTIADELAQLERLVLAGEEIAPENVDLLESCLAQSIRIRSAIDKQTDNIPRPDWMRKVDKPAATPGIKNWSRLVKQA